MSLVQSYVFHGTTLGHYPYNLCLLIKKCNFSGLIIYQANFGHEPCIIDSQYANKNNGQFTSLKPITTIEA